MGKKKQKSRVYRTSISISPNLKRRMDQVAEAVNWSALASRAFEDKLADISAKKEKKDMSDVVERLKKSKREHETQMVQWGREAGIAWAKNNADYEPLKRIAELPDDMNWPFALIDSKTLIDAAAADLEVDEFFGLTCHDDQSCFENQEFLVAFVDGARDVWLEVKDQL